VKSHGEEKACDLCRISNKPAPTTVRANPIKITREALMDRWKTRFKITPCSHSELGIVFLEKTNFFSLTEFQEGLFEVQDEGSQLLSKLMQVQPGQQVMDYCAGSGGKTLAFANQMQGKGQIFVHDIRTHALMEARKRLRRAGIQNAQTIEAESPNLKKIKKKMDWILVDAPCSGTGTMRRNPDMKWKFTEEMLVRLVGQQRVIFEKALSFLKPGGHIVYATCSMLKDENQDQIAHFLKTYPIDIVGEPFQSLPTEGGMDGFYGVVMTTKKSNPVEKEVVSIH
jgi:16S rRNA (cytosine967-C5)-methyltransferase